MSERKPTTLEDVEAATGFANETSVRLDYTCECYGRLELKYNALSREAEQLREALREISKLHVTEYTGTAYETTDDEAVRIARAALGDTEHE